MEYIGIEKYKVVNTVAGKQNGISWKLEFIVLVYRTNNPQINMSFHSCIPGADPGFQVRGGGGGAHLKKLRRAEGGTNIFGVFRVKIHDFTQKKQITESPSYP